MNLYWPVDRNLKKGDVIKIYSPRKIDIATVEFFFMRQSHICVLFTITLNGNKTTAGLREFEYRKITENEMMAYL